MATHRVTGELFRLFESRRCRHQAILAHFDEEMDPCDASCDVCTGSAVEEVAARAMAEQGGSVRDGRSGRRRAAGSSAAGRAAAPRVELAPADQVLDRKSTRLDSSHVQISYAVF